jgi:bacillolysin
VIFNTKFYDLDLILTLKFNLIMKKSLPFFMLLVFTSMVGFAQPRIMQKEVDKHGNISFMVFDNKASFIPMEQAKKLLRDTLRFQKNDDVVLKEEMKDDLGFTHQFYNQHYKGIKVEHGLYSVHSRNGKIESIDGEFKNIKNIDIKPSLSEKEALQKSLNYIHATKYKWEDPNEEQFIKHYKNDSSATNFPKGELLIVKDVLKTNSIYRLAYKFDIYAVKPLSHKLYYVDAISGKILNTENLICDGDAYTTGTATTRYSGTQSIVTDLFTSGGYHLREIRNGVRLETYNMQKGTSYSNTDFTDNDNNWTAAEYDNSNFDNAALDAHWGLEKVYDYWYSVRNRNSLDNNALPLLNYVHADIYNLTSHQSSNDNAFWDGQRMTYGDGQNTMNPVVSLDVIAHETGHGLTQFTCNLGTSGEPGALNEGFSDIWGAVIEHWAAPNDASKNTWLTGEQIMKDGTYLRSLSNPKSKGYPDTYQGSYWDSGNEVHRNSTVLSHWFYLLSQGGSGTNDLGNTYSVWGIGIDAAASIAYRAENVSLRSHSDASYSTAMTYINQAASELFGESSFEALQVKNAWYAVGIGSDYCSNGAPSAPTNLTSSGNTISWTASPGVVTGYRIYANNNLIQTSTATSAALNLGSCSTYNVSVSAYNCGGESAQTGTIPIVTVPSAPSGIDAGSTNLNCTLWWTAPPCSITGYHIYQDGNLIQTTTSTTAVIGYLQPVTTYNFSVSAFNDAGESSQRAQVTVTTTALSAPTNLQVTNISDTRCTLSWLGTYEATGYKIYQHSPSYAVYDSPGMSYNFTNLTPYTMYIFSVSAYNSKGESHTSPSIGFMTSSLAPPSNLTASNVIGSSCTLSWTAPGGTISGYYVYQNGEIFKWSTSTSITLSNLSLNSTYVYTVTTVNSTGESGQSSSVVVHTFAQEAPPTPTNFSAVGSGNKCYLSWREANNYVTGFHVYVYASSPTIPSFTIPVTSTSYTFGTASGIFGFAVSAYNSIGESPKTSIKTVTLNATLKSAAVTDTIIGNTKLDQVLLHPNPVTDKLFIEGLTDFDANIFDLAGKKVLSVAKANESIDVSGLAPGVYMVKITSAGEFLTKKIIKQ